MAIIKCPECGHQISDKAPVCPSCGVEIAGKVTKCPNCGEVYFKDQEMCPNCHRPTYTSQPPIPPTAASQASTYSQGTAYSQASTSQSQASTIPPTPQSTTRLSGTPTPLEPTQGILTEEMETPLLKVRRKRRRAAAPSLSSPSSLPFSFAE